jgi:triosephosphate isomerase
MIYAANFKMNHTRAKTQEYMAEIAPRVSALGDDRVILFPPATALDSYEGNFTIGTQNAYPATSGAYTGEIGISQLEEFGIDTILIGHSERREILGETQEQIAVKYSYFQEQGFEIIYCIGEPLEIREQGGSAVMEYLLAQFDGIDTSYEKLIVAYEPIWAIGTGRSATTEEIAQTHSELKRSVARPILYGGSVKPTNIDQITSIESVDGVLVGGASLEVDSFMGIVEG